MPVRPDATEIQDNLVDDDRDGIADEDAEDNPSTDALDHDGDHVTIAPDGIFAAGFEAG